MLAQAGPLLALLPEGLLREQVLQDLARQGGVAPEVLQAHWARRSAGRRGPHVEASEAADDGTPADMQGHAGMRGDGGKHRWNGRGASSRRPRLFSMAGHRAPARTATMLDRCAWVLSRNTAVWLAQPGETHEFLAGQPAPYGDFFIRLERVLHEHGPITMPALMEELRQSPAEGVDADDGLLLLLDRLMAFHDVADDEKPEVLLEAMLLSLRKQAIAEELNWLTESGDLSDEATVRRNALIRLRDELKRGSPAGTGAR